MLTMAHTRITSIKYHIINWLNMQTRCWIIAIWRISWGARVRTVQVYSQLLLCAATLPLHPIELMVTAGQSKSKALNQPHEHTRHNWATFIQCSLLGRKHENKNLFTASSCLYDRLYLDASAASTKSKRCFCRPQNKQKVVPDSGSIKSSKGMLGGRMGCWGKGPFCW